jgi:hypothetical protein
MSFNFEAPQKLLVEIWIQTGWPSHPSVPQTRKLPRTSTIRQGGPGQTAETTAEDDRESLPRRFGSQKWWEVSGKRRKKEKTNLVEGNTKTPKGNWIGYYSVRVLRFRSRLRPEIGTQANDVARQEAAAGGSLLHAAHPRRHRKREISHPTHTIVSSWAMMADG